MIIATHVPQFVHISCLRPLLHLATRVGHHRSHRACKIGAAELLLAASYELSRQSFTQMVERSSRDSFDSPITPSAYVSLSDMLTLEDMQRIALGSSSTWSTPLPTTSSSSTFHCRSGPCGQHVLHATSETKTCVTSEACRKDLWELVELATQHCVAICLSTSAGERNRCTSQRSYGT